MAPRPAEAKRANRAKTERLEPTARTAAARSRGASLTLATSSLSSRRFRETPPREAREGMVATAGMEVRGAILEGACRATATYFLLGVKVAMAEREGTPGQG